MSDSSYNVGPAKAWANRIETLREQAGMEECRCGRYYDPGDRGHDRCKPCRKGNPR